MFAKRKRIKNPEAIEKARKPYCEYCGRSGVVHVHHWLRTKGAGGDDVPENLISLCVHCHTKAHHGRISKDKFREIINRR